MLYKNKTDWNLLAKYMAGEADTRETESVLAWAEESPENKALLQEIKSDWQKMDSIDGRFDVDNAWNKLHGRISGNNNNRAFELPSVAKQRVFMRFSIPMRIAASLLLLAILGTALITTADRLQRVTVETAAGEKNRVVELPDGSSVYLNADTKLSYSARFGKKHRDVSLSGEAYFDVTPDKESPFRIFAGNALVRVVGTTFNVNTRKSNSLIEVYVESGIVELSQSGNIENSLLLHAGSIGVIGDQSISSTQPGNANSIAWKTGAMTFVDAPITEVIALLNNVYNVTITIEGERIDTIRINGSYQGDPLEDILQVIGQHNPQLTIAKSDETVYLSQ